MYCDKAENTHFLRQDTWTNIYYPDPSATKEFQSLYANVPYFKDFLKLHQKSKSPTPRILALKKIGLTNYHAGKRKRHWEVFKDAKPLFFLK